jgi:hypothetical protein
MSRVGRLIFNDKNVKLSIYLKDSVVVKFEDGYFLFEGVRLPKTMVEERLSAGGFLLKSNCSIHPIIQLHGNNTECVLIKNALCTFQIFLPVNLLWKVESRQEECF